MKKFFIIFFLFLNVFAKAQTWNQLNYSQDTTRILAFYFDSLTNELYLGGAFEYFNGVHANGIIKWNGSQWLPMGDGFSTGSTYQKAGIISITKYNGEIVAAGLFDSSGVTPFKMPIARWNGSQWLPFDTITEVHHPIGGTLRPNITDIISFNGKLFIIGEFQYPGPTNWFNYFAYWNDTIWQPGVRPANNFLYSYDSEFEIFNSDLYICYSYGIDSCYSGGPPSVPVNGLLKYNYPCRSVEEIGNWAPPERIHTMLDYNGSLYLGLDHFNPSYGSYITRYDGTNFFPVGAGLNWEVESLTIYQGQLVAAGRFLSDGTGVPFLPRIAVWDGTNWNPFPASCALDSWIYKIYGHDSLLFASGVFDSCGTSPLGYSAVYPVILTGIAEISNPSNHNFSIHPNPSIGEFEIVIDPAFSLQQADLHIIDITGRIMIDMPFNKEVRIIKINASHFNAGVYIAQLRNNDQVIYSSKLMVSK